MVICGFVLAIAMFLLWPSEPPPFITLVTLITAAAGYAVARYFKAQRVQRIGQIFLAMMVGVSWVQARTHWEAQQTGQPVFGETQVSGIVEWHEAQARGSRWDIRLQDAQGRFFRVRLYGKQAHLARAQPGCAITLTSI